MSDDPKDAERWEEAARIYGFGAMPDTVTLSNRQMEILDGIVNVLEERDDLSKSLADMMTVNAAMAQERDEALRQAKTYLDTGRKAVEERDTATREAEALREALRKIARDDWSWHGGGRSTRSAGRSGRIARAALGVPLDPEPDDGTGWVPRNQDAPA
jgi:hypothetical protein